MEIDDCLQAALGFVLRSMYTVCVGVLRFVNAGKRQHFRIFWS